MTRILNRILLLIVPVMLIITALVHGTVALADTTGTCPVFVGDKFCHNDCQPSLARPAGRFCAQSLYDGCCQYQGYNITCSIGSNSCGDQYYGDLTGSGHGSSCVQTNNDEGLCLAN